MRSRKSKLAAACAFAALVISAAAHAADSHTLTVNANVQGTCKFNSGSSSIDLTVDPTANTVVQGTAPIMYRCTKGTTPSFGFTPAAGGNLTLGSENIPYSFTTNNDGAGSGMGAGQDKTLNVVVSVDQTSAANVTPGTYTGQIAISVTP
jgi:spore coat protein U-like protein